ncbi:MAG: LacI family DNA-binding transcriptional regulator [Bacteroidota bacterium]
MSKAPITIKDIARKTGTSVTTVSRALSNSPLVRQETRELVQTIAREYNYVPSYRALSLKNSRTNTIGIIVPKLAHEFFSKVIRGAEQYAQDHRYKVILCPSNDSYEREVAHVQRLLDRRVDGIIACISNETKAFDHFANCVEEEVPLVFFDCVVDALDVPKVVLDDFNAGYQAVKHLIDQGCRQIGYLGGPAKVSVNENRYQGYLKAMKDAGLEVLDNHVSHCPSDDKTTAGSYADQLVEHTKLNGLFASTDILAISAIRAAKAKGLSVPGDLAVVGFSNWTIGKMYEPSITTMSQPGAKIGGKAAQALIRQIEHPDNRHPQKIIIESDLLIRESSLKENANH